MRSNFSSEISFPSLEILNNFERTDRLTAYGLTFIRASSRHWIQALGTYRLTNNKSKTSPAVDFNYQQQLAHH
jgi:hypothetical protein